MLTKPNVKASTNFSLCREGVSADVPIYVLNTDAKLESLSTALREPLRVAAANWAATGWLVSQYFKNCVVVDIGSTSTSIIPIVDGKVAARAKLTLTNSSAAN